MKETKLHDLYAVAWYHNIPDSGIENGVFEEVFLNEEDAIKAMNDDVDANLKDLQNEYDLGEINIVRENDYAYLQVGDGDYCVLKWDIRKVFFEEK